MSTSSSTSAASSAATLMKCTTTLAKVRMYKKHSLYFAAKAEKASAKLEGYMRALGKSDESSKMSKSCIRMKDAVIQINGIATTDGKDVDLTGEDTDIVKAIFNSIDDKLVRLDYVQIIPAMTTWRKIKSSNLSAKVINRMTPRVKECFRGMYPEMTLLLKSGMVDDKVSLEAEVNTIDKSLAYIVRLLDNLLPACTFAKHFETNHEDLYAALV
jgi:hypothetical protein